MFFNDLAVTKLRLIRSSSKDDSGKSSIPEIEVLFPDGSKDRMILTHHKPFFNMKNDTSCRLHGHLKTDPINSQVSMTGCLNKNMGKLIESVLESSAYLSNLVLNLSIYIRNRISRVDCNMK